MNLPKLILTDLDHTLLRSDGCVSEYTLRILRQCRERGARLVIATARYWIGAERYIEMLRPDYEITTDGTLVHSNGRCVYSRAFSIEETNGIVRALLDALPGAEITVADGRTVYWNSGHIAESEKLHKAVYCAYDAPLACGANKIVAELPDEAVARRIADGFRCALQGYRGERWYAFLPAGAGKIAAIRAMSADCGIDPADMAAFGDDQNDVGMLGFCGTGVAVANAIPEALAAADDVTASNDEDGVARWLARRCAAD